MISQTAEYALRAVVFLAEHPEGPSTIAAIAERTQVPPSYLAKVMQGLARHHLVTSHRGITGGFTLAREPVTLTLLEIVNAVDPVQRIFTCPLGLPEHEQLCSLHRRLDMAYAMFEEVLRGTTVAELLVTRIFPPVSKG